MKEGTIDKYTETTSGAVPGRNETSGHSVDVQRLI